MAGAKFTQSHADVEKPVDSEQIGQAGSCRPVNRDLRRVAAIIGLLIIVGACVMILVAGYLTHGIAWSIYVPIYDHILHSIPTPPGFLPDTDWSNRTPDEPCGSRAYQVSGEQSDLGSFYATELPRTGWELTQHSSRKSRVASAGYAYQDFDRLVLVNRQRYWLLVLTFTRGGPEKSGYVTITK